MTDPLPSSVLAEAVTAAESHVLNRITMWRAAAGEPGSIKLSDATLAMRRQIITDIIEAAAPAVSETRNPRR